MLHVPRPAIRWRPPSNLLVLGLIALAGAIAWTLAGALLAASARDLGPFVEEWFRIQGFFAVLAALYLGLLPFSGALAERMTALAKSSAPPTPQTRNHRLSKVAVVLFVAVIGTYTTTHLGFSAPPPSVWFFWATCALVCTLAGFATWHVVDVLKAANALERIDIEVFTYSPGKTRSLTRLAGYFAFFGLAMTVGYIFAFAGTLLGRWRADPTFVRIVQFLWPTVYVPTCLVVLAYPHLAIHRVIRREKERLIVAYQSQINALLAKSDQLDNPAIERVNALADLIERVERTPNFALTFPIAITTIATSAANIASVFIPKSLITSWLQTHLLP